MSNGTINCSKMYKLGISQSTFSCSHFFSSSISISVLSAPISSSWWLFKEVLRSWLCLYSERTSRWYWRLSSGGRAEGYEIPKSLSMSTSTWIRLQRSEPEDQMQYIVYTVCYSERLDEHLCGLNPALPACREMVCLNSLRILSLQPEHLPPPTARGLESRENLLQLVPKITAAPCGKTDI